MVIAATDGWHSYCSYWRLTQLLQLYGCSKSHAAFCSTVQTTAYKWCTHALMHTCMLSYIHAYMYTYTCLYVRTYKLTGKRENRDRQRHRTIDRQTHRQVQQLQWWWILESQKGRKSSCRVMCHVFIQTRWGYTSGQMPDSCRSESIIH